jgi:hypothetical protein
MPLIAKTDTKSIATAERGRPADPKMSAKRVIEKQRAELKTATGASVPATQRPKQDKGFAKPAAAAEHIAKRTRLFAQALMETENEASQTASQQPPRQEVRSIPVSQVVPQQQTPGALSLASVVDKPMTYEQQTSKPKAISITALRDNCVPQGQYQPFRRG